MIDILYDQTPRVAAWVFSQLPHSDDATAYSAIGLARRGEIVGGVVYNSYTGCDIDMTAVISRSVLWRPQFVIPMFRYPFIQLKCRRVSARVATRNKRSLAVLLHLGFKPDGYLRDALPDDDIILLGMLASECRWLERIQ